MLKGLKGLKGKAMQRGIVKFYREDLGYGFILPEGGGEGDDIFVHKSGIKEDSTWGAPQVSNLEPGQAVEYDLGSNKKGPCAINVKVVSEYA